MFNLEKPSWVGVVARLREEGDCCQVKEETDSFHAGSARGWWGSSEDQWVEAPGLGDK